MRFQNILALSAITLPSLSFSTNTTNPPDTIDINAYPTTPVETAAWSIIYTYPIAIFANFAGSVLRNVSVNEIFHQRALATPDNGGVVKPNVDTLYSRVVLDLSSHDVILTIPSIGADRFWLYPVYDAFGNVVSEIGIANGNKAGRYLIRRADDVFAAPGFDNTSSVDTTCGYQGVVNMPGSYGTMLIRLLLISNTTQDLDAVHAIQNASSLTPINRPTPQQQELQTPALNTTTLNGTFLGIKTPQQQLELAARLVPWNQPIVYSQRYRVASILAQAGLYDNHYHPVPSVNLTQAAAIANATINADVSSPANLENEGNNWTLPISSYQGYYGTNYNAAAYVALGGYQQLTTKQTLYPGFQGLTFSSLYTLPTNGSWLITFSGKPRLTKPGFWSFTVYGQDQNLIKNPVDRYEVGDRTYSLTYEDGTAVYGANASSKDGPFQILLQDANKTPPQNWTGNWLPAEQTFYMLVRWYIPQPAMTNGSYVYPHIQNISQILA